MHRLQPTQKQDGTQKSCINLNIHVTPVGALVPFLCLDWHQSERLPGGDRNMTGTQIPSLKWLKPHLKNQPGQSLSFSSSFKMKNTTIFNILNPQTSSSWCQTPLKKQQLINRPTRAPQHTESARFSPLRPGSARFSPTELPIVLLQPTQEQHSFLTSVCSFSIWWEACKRLRSLTSSDSFNTSKSEFHQCLKVWEQRVRFPNTTSGSKTPIFTKWNKLFHSAGEDHRGHGGGRKERSVRDYLAVVWECYTYKYRSTPWSVALLSISLHLFCLFFRTNAAFWLAGRFLLLGADLKRNASVCV